MTEHTLTPAMTPGILAATETAEKMTQLCIRLLESLTPELRHKGMIQTAAPADFLTRNTPKVEFEAADGLAAESMTIAQCKMLDQLIHEYIDRLPEMN